MATQYGVTSSGFVVKQQNIIIQEINNIIKSIWGPNVNLGPESNFGQFAGIFSEREALIWQVLEAVYNSQYPAGAEGTSVDNILALNNLRRLPATPTSTNQDNETGTQSYNEDVTLFGLLLWGSPGTSIPQNSTINTTASPALSFLTQATYVVGSLVNAVQTLVFSNAPNTGVFSLFVYDPAGNLCSIGGSQPTIAYNAIAGTTYFSIGTPSAGNFTLTLTQAGVALTTGNIPYNAGASGIQTAIRALSGYGAVIVNTSGSGFNIVWGSIANPITTINPGTLVGQTITKIHSIQASFNNLLDTTNNYYPFTDLIVSGSISGGSLTFTFGPANPIGANPSCATQQQALMSVDTNTLQNGSTVTNLTVENTTVGSGVWGNGSALSTTQGLGTAYGTISGYALCTATGPNFVAAGALSVIGSSVSGWQGVINQLDCVTGTNLEDDTQALTRRAELLASNAKTPLASIIDSVIQLLGTDTQSAVVGFENTNQSAFQVLTFSATPSAGSFSLNVGVSTTGSISYTASASTIQTAIRLLTGYSNVLVTGSWQYGFTINFNGSFGGQPQNLVSYASNTLNVTSNNPVFGRPGSAFEIVVDLGNSGITYQQVANTILANKAAGIQAYGAISNQYSVPTPNNYTCYDAYQNAYQIGISEPTIVPFYVTIALTTDLTDINPTFNPASIATIQQDIVAIGNAFGIGAVNTRGQIVGFGSQGLIGAFNNVPGILSYTLYFGTTASPGTNTNVTILSEQLAQFETQNVVVSYV